MPRTTDQWVVDIMTRHRPALERSVRKLVRDEDEAADICQEVAVRLLMAARNDGAPDVPAAWMLRVARNLAISRARRRSTAVRAADRLVDRREQPAVDAEVIHREALAAVRSTLASARTDDRAVILLAARGMPTREMAAELGRSELATRALLCRARARVRNELRQGEVP
jgi:RNA polymerase sigma-70 factor, ECF subfamily